MANFITALLYHFCLALPAAFTQPGPAFFFSRPAEPCTVYNCPGEGGTIPRALCAARSAAAACCTVTVVRSEEPPVAVAAAAAVASLTWHAARRRAYWSVGRSPEVFSSDALESFFLHSLKRRRLRLRRARKHITNTSRRN